MAEKLDLKKFYEETLPTEKNLDKLFLETLDHSVLGDKRKFLVASNRAFGILAHLEFASREEITELKPFLNLSLSNNSTLISVLASLKIIKFSKPPFFVLNPSAIPMIERYMKIFAAYEQQNGITNPYRK